MDCGQRAVRCQKTDPWITPAEASDFVETPDYAATRAWLEKLVAGWPSLKLESFGISSEWRDLYCVRASKGGADKPVLPVQGSVHSGETDGKDAGLMLLRDIAPRGKDTLLDKADLVFMPIFNVDGHERALAHRRPNQRGPRLPGLADDSAESEPQPRLSEGRCARDAGDDCADPQARPGAFSALDYLSPAQLEKQAVK